MAEVAWTFQALEDLEAVCLYIARDAPRVAEVFAARAFEATDHLGRFPRSGRVVPEIGREDVREVSLHGYCIMRCSSCHAATASLKCAMDSAGSFLAALT